MASTPPSTSTSQAPLAECLKDDPAVDPYFLARKPSDWSCFIYTTSKAKDGWRHDKVADRWKKSLSTIQGVKKLRGSEYHYRAGYLLRAFEMKGNGSDRAMIKNFMANWMQGWKRKRPSSTTSSSITRSTPVINVYNSTVGALAGVGSSTSSGQSFAPPHQSVPDATPQNTIDPSVDPLGVDSSACYIETTSGEETEKEDAGPEKKKARSQPTKSQPTQSQRDYRHETMTGFYKMNNESMRLKLCSDHYLNDVVCNACMALPDSHLSENLASTATLDLSSPTHRKWFEEDEWQQLVSFFPDIDEIATPDAYMKFIDRFFEVADLTQLEQELNSVPYRDISKPFDKEKHYDARWARNVLNALLVFLVRGNLMVADPSSQPLWESDELLRHSHLEDWWVLNIWAPIIDACLLSLPNITVERKEAACLATQARRNLDRECAADGRYEVGKKLDGIIKTLSDKSYEFGGMEVARSFAGQSATKWLGDSFKLAKTLRDMLKRLHDEVAHDAAATRRLQVVGFVTAGRQLQILRMVHVGGYVCLLMKDPILTMPTKVADLPDLVKILTAIYRCKQVVLRSVQLVVDKRRAKSREELKKMARKEPYVKESLFYPPNTP